MAHRGRSFQKKIDTVHWTYGSFATSSLAAGSIAAAMLGAQHLPETLLRVRGEWAALLEGTQTGGQGTAITCGMILVPEGTATTVLWSPVTDGDAPWFWWDTMHLFYEEYVADVVTSDLAAARRIIDSKAMRKIRNTEVQFVCENTTIGGFTAASVNVGASARFLAGS